jgi:pimeloyl-ACP methyl ester carboxylesterase
MYNNPNKFDTLMNLLEHTFIFASKRQVGYINDRIRYSNIGEPDLPINLPTLVIHGTEDTDVPFNHGESAFSRIHNSKLVTLEGSGHVAIISEWEKINKETNNFFKQNNFLIN